MSCQTFATSPSVALDGSKSGKFQKRTPIESRIENQRQRQKEYRARRTRETNTPAAAVNCRPVATSAPVTAAAGPSISRSIDHKRTRWSLSLSFPLIVDDNSPLPVDTRTDCLPSIRVKAKLHSIVPPGYPLLLYTHPQNNLFDKQDSPLIFNCNWQL